MWSLLTLFTGLAPPIIAMVTAIADRKAAEPSSACPVIRGSAAVRGARPVRSADWTVIYRDAGEQHEWRGAEPAMWNERVDGAVERMRIRAAATVPAPHPHAVPRQTRPQTAPAIPRPWQPPTAGATATARPPQPYAAHGQQQARSAPWQPHPHAAAPVTHAHAAAPLSPQPHPYLAPGTAQQPAARHVARHAARDTAGVARVPGQRLAPEPWPSAPAGGDR